MLLASPLESPGRSLSQKKQLALAQYKTAEKMREALNGRQESDRSKRDYKRVIEAYHKVYLITPNCSKADASIVAMAELLAEEGRAFDDADASKESINQYKFLMEQYPGSVYKTPAMFTIGKIYQEDLQDGAAAKAQFQDFLKAHPMHRLSPQAKQAIAEIEHPSPKNKIASKPRREETPAKAPDVTADDANQEDQPAVAQPVAGRRPLVTGIRHWSTPDYTRIAIDLQQEVQYEAGRIPSPDRIFFDLHGTKLAPELAGKSFEVDDGFLKRIRVAQYQVGMTRVVLEVAPVSEYSAFLLPNPYRLIIDIHGRQSANPLVAAKPSTANSSAASTVAASKPPARNSESTEKTLVAANQSVAGASNKAKDSSSKRTSDDESDASAAAAESKPPATMAAATKVTGGAAKDSSVSPTQEDEKGEAAERTANSPGLPADTKATTKPTTAPTFSAVTPRETPPHENKKEKSTREKQKEFDEIAREARPSADGQRGLIRALGLKIGKIVVDAGHGGHDTGTIGPHGLLEKDLVLDVSLRLGKLLERRMGADVVFTRSDDTFIPLETRTAVANQNQADLFISVHANSSRDPSARGVETYYLNFTSSPEALEVAARENAVSEQSIHELQDLVKKIALKEKIEESREFASDVQHAMHAGLSIKGSSMRDRGVKKAPFVVLIGANMPSVLAEISFVSNPKDERKLKTPDYRQKIAESLYRGIAEYVTGLSGVKMASAKTAGQ